MLTKSRFLFAAVALLIVIALSAFIAVGKDAVQLNRAGDSAIFEQLIENISAGKGAVSNVFAATQNFIEKGYAFHPMQKLLTTELTPPAETERNMLKFHAYWILFLLSPLVLIMQSSLALALTQTFTYAALFVGASWFIARNSSRPASFLLFSLLVICSPVFIGGIFGQFYPDRLFIAVGFFVCWAVYSRTSTAVIVIMAAISALLNERAALISGLIMVLMPFARGDKRPYPKEFYVSVLCGFALLAYAYAIKKLWLSNLYYDSFLPQSASELIARFSDPKFASDAVVFLCVNAIFLLLAFVKPRLGLLAAFIMLPNLVGTVGGAEKTGWLTHYHSYYYPVLIFCAAVGFVHLSERLKRPTLIGCSIVAIALGGWLFSREMQLNRIPPSGYLAGFYHSAMAKLKGQPTGYEIRNAAVSLFPEGSFVSTDELGMALLKGHVSVDMFPVSANRANYLFIPCDWIEGASQNPSAGFVVSIQWLESYGFAAAGPKSMPSIGRCLLQRR